MGIAELAVVLLIAACARPKPLKVGLDGGAHRHDVPVARDAPVARDVPTASDTPERPITLGFAGDVALTEGLASRRPFEAVAPWLSEASQTWVNLETVVSDGDAGVAAPKEFVFRSPPETIALLRAAGVDGVSLANNHAFDYGVDGLRSTLWLVDAGGLLRAGAGDDHAAAWSPTVSVVEGRRVAVFGFYRMNCDYPWTPRRDRPGIACARPAWEDETVAAIEDARRAGSLVVVMVHWGTELSPCPDRWQRALASRWARAGASLVVGSHPHVLQGVERIHGAWVLYSIGNFAFMMASHETARTAFFEAGFDGRARSLRARPALIVDGRPEPATGADGRTILALLTRRSNALRFDDEGRALESSDEGACPWPRIDE